MSCMIPPACVFCEHYHHERNEQTDRLPSCNAFSAIPEEIILDSYDHSRAYPGDRGVRFSVDERYRTDFVELNGIRQEFGLSVYRVPLKLIAS